MKIKIDYISKHYYNKNNIIQWIFKFKKYKYIKGFYIRMFGININIRESGLIEKLLKN